MLQVHLSGGMESAQQKKRRLLAADCSILGRRRRREVWPNRPQKKKFRLKLNYLVCERDKMGIFKEIWKSPKFEHSDALEGI